VVMALAVVVLVAELASIRRYRRDGDRDWAAGV